MEKKQINLRVNGMSCNLCEIKLKKVLSEVKGIYKVKVNRNTNNVFLLYNPEEVNIEKIKDLIKNTGYNVERILSNKKQDFPESSYLYFFIILLVIIALFLVQNSFGVYFLPVINTEMGYGILFLVGLLTSLHCVGMCGGINLSQSIKIPDELIKSDSCSNNFILTLKYNAGRIISYTLIGGIIGEIGEIFAFSPFSKGFIFIIGGIFMLMIGMNLLGIFSLLGFLSKILGSLYSKVNIKGKSVGPFFVGVLNGFMPCGPLQGMQIYALSTGGFLPGALSMFFFALGTFPLMLGFGALATFLSKNFAKSMMKISGIVVIFLSITMFFNGFTLTGNPLPKIEKKDFDVANIDGDIQTIFSELESTRFPSIVVQKDKPVRWIIRADENSLNGCNNAIVIPSYEIEKRLISGINIIEFIPTREGVFYYSCWMGMISGTIKVVKDQN